ncbi:uncharacterized protein A1O5_07407 [Cladophialophora psammophila CBS 110553]|uniref:Uncharacterized protein n=1 Tax=Cladophialophora psammophila CBS 110553 TaxID=1182543 RepID=W9WXL6_9EURO|nr:uncharacterized protein A1O5_07407 [Cladophialophora psammophila CBS 110553]EXJ69371.1 hypothetical protein A1O5_07407 [Cladophialophora psammophila CBS 110553]
MSPFHSFVLLAGVLFHIAYGYVDFGSLTLPFEPIYQPTPRPNQLPDDYDLRYEVLPSMITAVAPSVTIAGNGSHQTMYSLHYHHYFSKTRQGSGIFDKRGVFASDPPIATCTPCGGGTFVNIYKEYSNCHQRNKSSHHDYFHLDFSYDSNYKHDKLFCIVPSAIYLSNVKPSYQHHQLIDHCCLKHNHNNHELWCRRFNRRKWNILFTVYIDRNYRHRVKRIIHSDFGFARYNNNAKYHHRLRASFRKWHLGTGTIYLGGTPIVTSGTASGSASNVSGCGTIIATNGTFTGSAEITGCGSGSGTGTLTGTGTVWPAYGGGHISFVTSGTVSGNGNFSGCGTLTGSGTFVATTGSPVVITPTTTPTPTSRPIRTVSVYLSYCPESTMGINDILRLASGSNVTSLSGPILNMTSSSSTSTNSTVLPASNSTVSNPLCQTCPNSVGICCPPTVHCSADDGKCPLYALENSGNTINGYLIAQVMNSSAPVAGRKKIRALEKKHNNVGKGFGGKDLVELEVEVERQLKRRQEKKRAHRKQF